MPRYFIDTYDGVHNRDEAGFDVAGPAEVRALVRRALAHLMADEQAGHRALQLRADVRDEAGKRVMTASLCMVIDER